VEQCPWIWKLVNTMETDISVQEAFSRWRPCLYKGAIQCEDCDRYSKNLQQCDDGCDMAAGRNLHREAFEAGYFYAKKEEKDKD